jgi:hypothetical protein
MSSRYNHGSHYENHQRAAELHDNAAHAHLTAAEAYEKQDHESGHERSRRALEYTQQAHEHTDQIRRGFRNALGVAVSGNHDTASLAHSLWQARGCPAGSPEEDWFHAVQILRARGESQPE